MSAHKMPRWVREVRGGGGEDPKRFITRNNEGLENEDLMKGL